MKESFFRSSGKIYLIIIVGVILIIGFLLGAIFSHLRTRYSDRLIERDKVKSLTTYTIESTGNIEVRKGPGDEHPVFYRLKMGEVVKLLNKGEEWSLVELQDGRMGYVSNKFLTEADISVSVIKSGWVLEADTKEGEHEWQPRIQLLVLDLKEEPVTDMKIKGIFYRESEIWAEDTETIVSPSQPPLVKGDSKKVFLEYPLDYTNFDFTTWVDTAIKAEIYASIDNRGFKLIKTFELPKTQYPLESTDAQEVLDNR
jgi:uncharacterized protein YgiM (DUF1202 family)